MGESEKVRFSNAILRTVRCDNKCSTARRIVGAKHASAGWEKAQCAMPTPSSQIDGDI